MVGFPVTIFEAAPPVLVEPALVRPMSPVTRLIPELVGRSVETASRVSSPPTNPIRWNVVRPFRANRVGSSGGKGAGKNFTEKVKKETFEENKQSNGGDAKCKDCGQTIERLGQSKKGETPPSNQAQGDHINPKNPSDGSPQGNNTSDNLQWLCQGCNGTKSNISPQQYYYTPPTTPPVVIPFKKPEGQ
jgi:5-methylcytosine-specific restriction endonuclease McrA